MTTSIGTLVLDALPRCWDHVRSVLPFLPGSNVLPTAESPWGIALACGCLSLLSLPLLLTWIRTILLARNAWLARHPPNRAPNHHPGGGWFPLTRWFQPPNMVLLVISPRSSSDSSTGGEEAVALAGIQHQSGEAVLSPSGRGSDTTTSLSYTSVRHRRSAVQSPPPTLPYPLERSHNH